MNECTFGNEHLRLQALQRYDVLDTAPEEAFDRITRLARTVLQMPIVLVSLVDRERQWFKSRQGMQAAQTPRNISFCTHTIQSNKLLMVPDTHADARFASNPMVSGPPHIRFYIGVPLRTREGHNIGALCSMDTKPRELTDDQIEMLKDLARLVMDELELRLLATTDSLTNAMSRRAFHEQAARDLTRCNADPRDLACLLIDADHFKSINDKYGHSGGDLVLQEMVSAWHSELNDSDYIGRVGGEEFAVMLPNTSLPAALNTAERLRRVVEDSKIASSSGEIRLTASIGVAMYGPDATTVENLLRNADIALYEAKARGRNRVISYKGMEAAAETPASHARCA